eukprot:TCONS_00032233-protein
MASKHLKISFQQKRGRKECPLLKAEEEWLFAFLDRPDISRQTPGRKDSVYLRKVNGKSEYAQKRYLQWTLKELLDIINGNKEVEKSSSFREEFERDLSFRQLHNFIKMNKQYKFSNQTPHESCTCEVCENVHLLTMAVNRKIRNIDNKLPTSVKEIIAEFSCPVPKKECSLSRCGECPVVKVCKEDFLDQDDQDDVSSDESEEGSENEETEDEIKYFEWATVDGKAAKVQRSVGYDEIGDILATKIKELKLHIHVRNEQYQTYTTLKETMPGNAILVHVDYAESYENKQQDECQSAYFGHTNFSIFTAVVYFRRNGELLHENIVIVSETTDHSRIAAHSCILKVIDIMMERHPHFNQFHSIDLHIWSDGCASQFRSKYVFALTPFFPKPFIVTRYYNERHHGKGPMDGLGGCVKNLVYRAVMSKKEVITTPEQFARCAQKLSKNVVCVYMPSKEVMREPGCIEKAPYNADMQILQVHMAKIENTRAGFHCMKLYQIASDPKPFYTQWYNKADGTVPCGHFDTIDMDEIITTCAKCLLGETGDGWLQCPRCSQWYHDECFYDS